MGTRQAKKELTSVILKKLPGSGSVQPSCGNEEMNKRFEEKPDVTVTHFAYKVRVH
jgi:hypothetical protein